MIKILDSSLNRQAILQDVINPNRFEEINGENTLTFTTILDEKASLYIDENAVVELDNDYFDIAFYKKNQNEDGTLTVEVEAEHISYRLNNPEYNVDSFVKIGTPSEILSDILSGTGFTIGDVEFLDSVTYYSQEKKSRRQLLMEFITYIGGEVIFKKFEISIVQHRGEIEPKLLTTGKNIRVVSKIFNKRESDKLGNPLVAYTCEPIQLPSSQLNLGDEVLLIHKELGIQEIMRVVRMGYNPFNLRESQIELANFISGIEDQLYKISTSTVAKEKIYNGCKIGAEEGFVAERSDGKAKSVMNATEGISVYSDIGQGLVKNFFVDTDGRIKARSIDILEDGSFGGNIKTDKNAYVGGNLFLGEQDASVTKKIWFNNYVNIEAKADSGWVIKFNCGILEFLGSMRGEWYFNNAYVGGLENSGYVKQSDIDSAIAAHEAAYHTT